MGVKGKPDVIGIIERKRLQCYGHVGRMPEERITKLIVKYEAYSESKGRLVSKKNIFVRHIFY